ncbi:thermoresistant gluconokinase family protein [Delitschia confertaspora ATCC 74209]|uniref:Gluconokinase n=1 Tax=Delitschia confertaspora ATCC 74209 TaxID=1513339 RepID=A0A9P4MTG3_9PLEO|nr:thermoresistant gluconokinase family protein [Delitschia confertaspora ATCC 74209]
MLQTFEPTHQPPLLYTSTSSSAVAPTQETRNINTMAVASHHNILIVTGPAGSGKSTVAMELAKKYGFKYIEGDDFHPQANIDKMAHGIPLTDADRWDWLILLRDQAVTACRQGAKGAVVTCSALKKKYRDVIRTARFYDDDPNASVHFIYLHANMETLLARVKARQGHYMKDDMVISQLKALEKPDADEIERIRDVITIDVSCSMQEVIKRASNAVDEVLAEDAATSQGS